MENENQNGGGETCAVCSQPVTTEDKDTHARTHEEKEVGNERKSGGNGEKSDGGEEGEDNGKVEEAGEEEKKNVQK